MDPHAVLGVSPGASKAEIKKAFFQKAKQHHPDMHTTASDSVQSANAAAFRVLSEAYNALMEGDPQRLRQRGAGRGGFARAGAGYYGGAAGSGAAYGGAGAYGDPFHSAYGPDAGSNYSGWRQFRRMRGLDFRGAFRALTSISRAEVGATAALGLLLAGGAFLLDDASAALWARNNDGKLFDSIKEDVERRKQQKAAAAAEAAAAAAALRAATAGMRESAAREQGVAALGGVGERQQMQAQSSSTIQAQAAPAAPAEAAGMRAPALLAASSHEPDVRSTAPPSVENGREAGISAGPATVQQSMLGGGPLSATLLKDSTAVSGCGSSSSSSSSTAGSRGAEPPSLRQAAQAEADGGTPAG